MCYWILSNRFVGFIQGQKCHHLKPFGIADFTEFAALWDICSSRLRLHVSCLAPPANSTIAQFRL